MASADVNGDGFSDVIVGADRYANGESQEGAVFVYLGSSTGLNMVHSWMTESQQVDALFGRSAGSVGDANGVNPSATCAPHISLSVAGGHEAVTAVPVVHGSRDQRGGPVTTVTRSRRTRRASEAC